MTSGNDSDTCIEWLVTIGVSLAALALSWFGYWPLGLIAAANGLALFVVLLCHDLDPARRKQKVLGKKPKKRSATRAPEEI